MLMLKSILPLDIWYVLYLYFIYLLNIIRCHSIDSVYEDVVNRMHDDESSKISYDTIQIMSTMFANFARYGYGLSLSCSSR